MLRLVLPACTLLCAFAISAASAAEFQLSPTRVQLDARQRAETVTVGNSGSQALRFEVTVKRWRMATDGSWELEPSDDLIVHPLLLEIAPGGKSRLRVGLLEPPAAGPEQAYRVELDELPGAATASGPSLKMLTRVSLPVFVQAQAGKPRPALVAPLVDAGALEFGLRNDGDSSLPPQALALELLGTGGAVLDRQQLQGNYVLAGATLPIKARVPAALCTRVAAIGLALTGTGERLDLLLPATAKHCVP
jgi:fimbrial chaperone protein